MIVSYCKVEPFGIGCPLTQDPYLFFELWLAVKGDDSKLITTCSEDFLSFEDLLKSLLSRSLDADILLVMSVPAGFGGQTFHYEALESVRALRSLAPDDAVIEIDGGIDENTIGAAAIAGANLLVAGTGVFKASDYGDQMTKLRERALSALRDCGE